MPKMKFEEIWARKQKLKETPEFQTFYEEEVKKEIARHRDWLESQALQKVCDHPSDAVRYCPDASGNNDSWYECAICGKEV